MVQPQVSDSIIAYGINPIEEAFRSQRLPQQVLYERSNRKPHPRREHILRLASQRQVPCEEVRGLNRYCGNNAVHQGIAAVFLRDQLEQDGLPDLSAVSRVVVFDGIEDPHNFGAALRVCECMGFTEVIYQKHNSSGLTPTAIKTSAGAVFHLNLYQIKLKRAIDRLKENGFQIIVLEGDGELDLYRSALPSRFALILGSEGKGVRMPIRRVADAALRIPLAGHVNSLNVSCALSAALAVIRAKEETALPNQNNSQVTITG